MKPVALALLAAAAAFAASSAHAHTAGHIGINLGKPAYRPAPRVVVAPAPVAHCPPPAVVVAPPPRGYWKEVQVKTWVPTRTVVGRDFRGRPVQIFEPGRYVYTTQRVWVDGRADRGYSYTPPSHGGWRR
jgi:hypothetical protein